LLSQAFGDFCRRILLQFSQENLEDLRKNRWFSRGLRAELLVWREFQPLKKENAKGVDKSR
jgi:hypothetical protein